MTKLEGWRREGVARKVERAWFAKLDARATGP